MSSSPDDRPGTTRRDTPHPEGAHPDGTRAPRVLVVVPTYDEAENVEVIAGRLLAAVPAADLLVVDDDSPDGTGRIADAMASRDDRVHVLHRTAKAGLGAAYVAGFRWGLDAGYDVLVEMDADGSHAPEELPSLLAALRGTPDDGGDDRVEGTEGGADLVLGSRWVEGGSVVDWPRSRMLLSRGGNLYTRLLMGLPLQDATGGYRAYRREVLEVLDLDAVTSQGYCFQVDLAWRTWQAGFDIAEVPITFVERQRGTSKMDSAIVREALWRITLWGLSRGTARRRRGRSAPVPARRTTAPGG